MGDVGAEGVSDMAGTVVGVRLGCCGIVGLGVPVVKIGRAHV